uniref:p505_2R n=1 Tax=African swine fever virus TaxID=10497 RepID=A0A6G7KU52_ASF
MFLASMYYNDYDCIGDVTAPFNAYETTTSSYGGISSFPPTRPYEWREKKETMQYYSSCYCGREIFITPSYEPCRVFNMSCSICMQTKSATFILSYHCFKMRKRLQNATLYNVIVVFHVCYNMLQNTTCSLFSKHTKKSCLCEHIFAKPYLYYRACGRGMLSLYGYSKPCMFTTYRLCLLLPSPRGICRCIPYDIFFFLLQRTPKLRCYHNISRRQRPRGSSTLCYKRYNTAVSYISSCLKPYSTIIQNFYIIFCVNYLVYILQSFCCWPCRKRLLRKHCTYCCPIYTTPCNASKNCCAMCYSTSPPWCYRFYYKKEYTCYMPCWKRWYDIFLRRKCGRSWMCFRLLRKESLRWLYRKCERISYSILLMFGRMFYNDLLVLQIWYTPYSMYMGKKCYLQSCTAYTKTYYMAKEKKSCFIYLCSMLLKTRPPNSETFVWTVTNWMWHGLYRGLCNYCYTVYKLLLQNLAILSWKSLENILFPYLL